MRTSKGWAWATAGGALAFAVAIVWVVVATDAPAPGQPPARAATQLQPSPEDAESPQLQVLSGAPASVLADRLALSTGEELRVHWRKIPSPRMEISPPFADDYVRLRKMALNGDPVAGFKLWQILNSCKYGYSDRQRFEAAIKMLNETHYLLVPGRNEPVLITNMRAVEGWQRMLPILHHQCQGIIPDHKTEALDWLAMAAQSGMPIAMMRMSDNISVYKRGVEFDEARWRAGDATALRDLAERYYRSYNSGEHPQNKTKFYAALYAYGQIARTRFSNPQDRSSGRYEHVENELNAATQEMLPYELAEAIAMAEETLRSNPNCCFEF